MIVDLFDRITGLWGPTDHRAQLERDTRKRANRAYKAAWKRRVNEPVDSDAPLLRELRAHNVPGAFAKAQSDPTLMFYFSQWRAGRDPETVRAESQKSRR